MGTEEGRSTGLSPDSEIVFPRDSDIEVGLEMFQADAGTPQGRRDTKTWTGRQDRATVDVTK